MIPFDRNQNLSRFYRDAIIIDMKHSFRKNNTEELNAV